MDPITIALGVAKLAPMVAGWLGGDDAEKKAQKVVDVAESVTGLSGQSAVNMLSSDAAALEKFNERILEEMRLHSKDRDSARGLTATLAKAGHKAAWASPILSLVVVVGFFGMIYTVLKAEIPESSKEIAFILLGALGAGFTQVLNFWLGSSKSSQDKTPLIGK